MPISPLISAKTLILLNSFIFAVFESIFRTNSLKSDVFLHLSISLYLYLPFILPYEHFTGPSTLSGNLTPPLRSFFIIPSISCDASAAHSSFSPLIPITHISHTGGKISARLTAISSL